MLAASITKDTLPERVIGQLEEAIRLYRGEYLGDLDYTWVPPLQVRLNQLYLDTRLRLARYYLAEKDYLGALKHLMVLEELHPLHEEVHQLLMTVYARMGNKKAIKEQYQILKSILAKEIGLETSPDSENLYHELLG